MGKILEKFRYYGKLALIGITFPISAPAIILADVATGRDSFTPPWVQRQQRMKVQAEEMENKVAYKKTYAYKYAQDSNVS